MADFDTDAGHTKYLPCALVVQLFILSQTEQGFPWTTWWMLIKARGKVNRTNDSSHGEIDAGLFEVGLRVFMSFLVNMIYSKMLILVMPSVLMGCPSGYDFVKDAFAVTFISTLDVRETGVRFVVERWGQDSTTTQMSTLSSDSVFAS
eukprot:TRINITY_DN45080_c0_g1_i1.p1 TRINITY_DN45080_c0_g1~~TRINITY_DN45080_c0_g1_i1.p1  ORF type:complete len:148 (+),score=27.78 TRINITY_DN45080_c0_g1_i1:3-446(+)